MKKHIDSIISEIIRIFEKNNSVVIAIDGRCASGKTTLAEMLAEKIDCNIFHTDDFFLRPEQRTAERLSTPGGNVDYERFFADVLKPISKKETVSYCRYDCKSKKIQEGILISYKPINIIEGSYSCHPELSSFYDFKIFVDVNKEEQLLRIEQRNGKENVNSFKELWIPMEEKYFEHFSVRKKCDYIIN